MAWNGQVPTEANWQGNPQFPGSEELYITPDPPTTATNPSIGIRDGNEISLPTAYNTFNVATLGATTINSTNINNAENINTATINGNPVPTSAERWSLYPAISDVVANQAKADAYVPLQPYLVGDDASLGDPVYTNYQCFLAGATMNPLERLDPWLAGHTYTVGVDWGCLYNGVEYITIATNVGDVLPTNTSYFRPANYSNTYGYSAGDIVYQPTGISPGWYQSDNGSTGTAPPNLFAWTPINFWDFTPVVPDPAWDIKGFKDVQSASVHTDELTVANQTTLGDGGDALVVNGGTTLDGGALHGTTIGSLPVSGINTVRLDVLPAGIEMTSITGIIMNSTLATEIGAGGGLVLAAGGAASLAAGGALSLAGGDYIEYNTDENRFINTSAGNDYTDIKVGNILPAHDGSANLRINGGGSGRGVEIADGVTIVTQSADTNILKVAQSTIVPALYDSAVTYNVNQIVRYDDGGGIIQLYICIAATTGNAPTDTAYWRLAEYSDATEYFTGDIVFLTDGFNFYVSLTSGNIDHYPSSTIGVYWDLYYGLSYGLSQQGIQFKKVAGDTIIKSIVKEVGDPKLYVLTTSETNADISKGEIFTVPASQNLNLNGFDITNVNTINSGPDYGGTLNFRTPLTGGGGMNAIIGGSFQLFGGNTNGGGTIINGDVKFETGNNVEFKSNNGGSITLNNNIAKEAGRPDNRDITITAGKNGEFSSVSSLVLNSSTADSLLGAYTAIAITSTTGTVSLTAGAGQTVNVNSNLNLTNKNIANANTITGQTALTLATTGNNNLSISPAGTGLIVATKGLNLSNNNITNANTITGQGALTLASGTNTNIVLSPAGTGVISATKSLNMNNASITNCNAVLSSTDLSLNGGTGNSIVALKDLNMSNLNINNANTITGQGALTLATTGATNLNLSPASTGLIVATKGLNLSNNNITNANTITGQGALTLATTGATNLSLSPASTGTIVATKDLNMSNNNITNANTITGQTTLTLATTTNGSLNLSPDGAGTIIANKTINMLNNNIGAANTITGNTSLTLASASNGNIAINPNGTGVVIIGKELLMGSNGISQVPSITSTSSLTFVTGAGANNQAINCSNNALTNVATINGRNLFSYGNFYNTATQTLTATNTATRVVMNTSLNNNLITLDSVTNIGRITFTNAGVYHVVWNAYLLHGSGGTVKSCIWIRLNGTDVAGSGKTGNNDASQNETNLTSSSLVSVTASQYIEFYWAAASVSVPLTAVAASSPYPATPSFSCTISIVG